MTLNVDLLVVGSGPAAGTVAAEQAGNGKKVAIADRRTFGGTCALRGCNPKKVYTEAGALVQQIRGAGETYFDRVDVQPNWSRLHAFKREFTDPVAEGSEKKFQDKGIETLEGVAQFEEERVVRVGEQTVRSERIFLAVGAAPVSLGFPGEEHLQKSDDFLELESLPDEIVFIGGGYISMEFSHVAARFGAKVTILQQGKQILSGFDPDLVEQLANWSGEQGIDIRTHARATGIERNDAGRFRVTYEDKAGNAHEVAADAVFHGAGRRPNIDDLQLDAGNVSYSEKGICIDPFLRNPKNRSVFAGGDCADTGRPALTPVANEDARIVNKNLFASDPTETPDYGAIPRVAFTTPPLARVGLLENEAKREGREIDVRHDDMSTWGSLRKRRVPCGGYKILVDKQTDKILGAHLLGPGCEETINFFALAIRYGLSASDLKATLFVFPTMSSDVRSML